MFLSDLSIHRPVMMTMFLVALLLFGVLGFLALPLNLMPDAKIPFVTVQTVYPGANPEQIETQITRRIEDEVGTVSEIKSIQSYSLDSASFVVIEFELSKDPDVATQEVKDKVDLIVNDLPADANTPITQKLDFTEMPIVNIIMSGDVDPVLMSQLAETTVKDRISRIAGVGNVSISGSRQREIRVEFVNAVVYENQINLAQVGQIIAAANLDMPGGNMQTRGQDFSVRLDGQFAAINEIADLDIPTAAGSRRLGSIATVRDASEDVRERTIFFDTRTGIRDENTVRIGVIKSPDGNPVEIAEELRALFPTLQDTLPEGITLTVTSDQSVEIQDTVNDTLGNIGLGIFLTAVILLLFLHDLRSTLIVALAMPMSIIPTFLVMNALGMSLNLMSLMGLSTAVGVLVMNSVVVLENIFRHKEMGHSRTEAASRGTSEVVVAVVASTLTNIAVFLPMATMGGLAGLFLQEFALSVSFATIFSMLISFTLTPMLASRLLPEHDRKKHPIGTVLENNFHALERGYAVILEKVLHSKVRSALLIGVTLAVFVVTILQFGRIPFEFAPFSDSGSINVEVELPQGTDLTRTAATLETVEARIASFDEVETITTTIGSISAISGGTNMASVDVELIDKTLRAPHVVVATRIGGALADIPGARIRSAARSDMGMGGAPVVFYLQGDDTDTLAALARELRPRLQEVPGLIGIDTSSKPGSPEVVLYPDRLKLNDVGLTVQDLATTMRAAVEGMVMTTFRDGGEEYDIRVTLADADVAG
jgi:HAE1 family hydrophobic/amphiphilic exporter-1